MNGSLVNKPGRPTMATCHGLNMLGPGNGTIRCGFVRVGMVLLEEVCHCGDGL